MLDYDSVMTFELSIQCKLDVYCVREVKYNESRNKATTKKSLGGPLFIL